MNPPSPPDHPDEAPDRAHVLGVVDRDVLVDRRLAERHREAEDDGEGDEGGQRDGDVERDRPFDPLDHVVRRRVAQEEAHEDAHDERPVHDEARAVAIREVSAEGPEDAAGERVGGGQHARGLHVEAVDADVVAREPEGQGHERPEDEEVVEGEPPDLEVPQGLELQERRARLLPRRLARRGDRVLLRRDEEQDRGDEEDHGVDLGRPLPSEREEQERRPEVGDRRAHVPDAEHAEGGPLAVALVPARHEGDADRERAPREPDPEGGEEEHRVRADGGEHPGGDRGHRHQQRVDDAPAVLVGPDPEKDAAQATGQDRGRDEDAELGVGEPEILLDADPDDGEDGPDREADGERERADTEGLVLLARRNVSESLHRPIPRRPPVRPTRAGRPAAREGITRAGRHRPHGPARRP